MNALDLSLAGAVPGVTLADSQQDLRALLAPGCAATIWRRDPRPGFQDWIDGLAPDLLPRGRVVIRHEALGEEVRQLSAAAGTPQGPELDWLVEDISTLASDFTEMMKAPYLRLRLDVVTTNACRKFHVDAILARLICTYRGTGTQYGAAIDHEDPSRIETVPTGSPVVLRGSLFPEEPRSGLLHRSPPIEGTRETRLVLVLDPIYDLEGEL